MHAEEDKKRKEMVEAKNTADSMVYQTEKALKENEDKIDAETKSGIEAAVAELKTAMEGDDVEAIKAKTEALTQASHKLAEAMYQQQAAGGEAGAEGAEQAAPADDDVVDADFEEVKSDK